MVGTLFSHTFPDDSFTCWKTIVHRQLVGLTALAWSLDMQADAVVYAGKDGTALSSSVEPYTQDTLLFTVPCFIRQWSPDLPEKSTFSHLHNDQQYFVALTCSCLPSTIPRLWFLTKFGIFCRESRLDIPSRRSSVSGHRFWVKRRRPTLRKGLLCSSVDAGAPLQVAGMAEWWSASASPLKRLRKRKTHADCGARSNGATNGVHCYSWWQAALSKAAMMAKQGVHGPIENGRSIWKDSKRQTSLTDLWSQQLIIVSVWSSDN